MASDYDEGEDGCGAGGSAAEWWPFSICEQPFENALATLMPDSLIFKEN